jgi:glycosidase
VGLQNDTLELLLHNEEGFKGGPSLTKGNAQILSWEVAQNPQYAYLSLELSQAKAGQLLIKWENCQLKYRLKYQFAQRQGAINGSDALYLITPDRFANGDSKNDGQLNMNDTLHGREHPFGRHGGDIKGIHDKVEYIEDLGFTALWISPLLENDEFKESYHGYAITDHYNIDPRFGSNEDYRKLVENLHSRGMKMVMDVVYNHFGSQHHLFLNPPDSNFFHFDMAKVRTNYRAVSIMDPHVSQADLKNFNDGWFDDHMPDVNQKDPHMALFLIQNSLWWIFEYGIDAFRIDTYAYPDQGFMAELGSRIKMEVPDFFLFGEIWVHMPEIQSYFAGNNKHNPYESHLDGVTDFQFKYAAKEAVKNQQDWTSGVAKLYYRLAADYLYKDPQQLVTFIDNHDEARILGELEGDTAKLKVLLGWLYTMRGIPCTYYGTEIGMRETANHGLIRQPFPGGWPDDKENKFTPEGRNELENALFNYIQKLLQWRSSNTAAQSGTMKHFIPEDDVYTYFRVDEQSTVMVISNTHPNEERVVDLSRFAEVWPAGIGVTEVLTGELLEGQELKIAPMSIKIFEVQP